MKLSVQSVFHQPPSYCLTEILKVLIKMIVSFKCSFLYFVLVNGLVQGSVSFIHDNNYENSSRFELHRRFKRNSVGPTREPRFLKFQNLNDSIDVKYFHNYYFYFFYNFMCLFKIEMQFEVPFLDIPVQRSINALKRVSFLVA